MTAEEQTLAVARIRSWLRSGRARMIRRRAAMSQEEVGRAVGSDASQISRWEHGVAVPHHAMALRLWKVYAGFDEIVQGEDEAPHEQ